MKSEMKKALGGFLATVMAIFLFLPVCWADEVIIIGEVNDTYQIEVDNQLYEVAENTLGNELVKRFIGQKVKVTGYLTEKDDMKIITVKSFEVMQE